MKIDRHTIFAAVCIVALVLVVVSCRRATLESAGPPAPSSSMTAKEAAEWAQLMSFASGRTVAAFTATGSMLPVMDSRTVAVMEPVTPATRFHVGDIVSFQRGEGLVCHRVTAVEGDFVLTSGESANSNDGWHRPVLRVVALFYPSR